MKERIIKSFLVATALGIASVGAYKAVEAIDSSMVPTYVPSGEAPYMPEEQQPWMPRTDWNRKPKEIVVFEK